MVDPKLIEILGSNRITFAFFCQHFSINFIEKEKAEGNLRKDEQIRKKMPLNWLTLAFDICCFCSSRRVASKLEICLYCKLKMALSNKNDI